jgi:hypothetical protein
MKEILRQTRDMAVWKNSKLRYIMGAEATFCTVRLIYTQ